MENAKNKNAIILIFAYLNRDSIIYITFKYHELTYLHTIYWRCLSKNEKKYDKYYY